MKKIKLSTKAVLSLGLSAVLFCMPAVGFALNGNYAVNVHAEDSKEQEAVSEEPAQGRRKPTQSRVQRAARKKARRIQQRKVRKTVRFPEMK